MKPFKGAKYMRESKKKENRVNPCDKLGLKGEVH